MPEPPLPEPDRGVFAWKMRMGIHEAYHRSVVNRILHWVCIPFELWAVVKLLSLVPLWGPADLALAVIALTVPVFLLTEPLVGAVMIAFLLGCWKTATMSLAGQPLIGAALALVLFGVTFGAQVLVGHRIFEEGRDDTEKNLAEFARTKNPVPLLLVFYYHLVEVALGMGYRPRLSREIRSFTEREIASWSS